MPAGGRAHDPHGGSARVTAAFGINLAGHLTSPQGLGVAARHTAHVLDERGTPWAGVDVPTPVPATHPVRLLASRCVSPATLAPHGVNLLHLNPPEVLELLWARPHWLDTETRVTACVPFWEFPHLPPSWLDGVACMDAVLAPSRFIEAVVRRALPELPVFHFAQAVWLPAGIRADRARFGLPANSCLFVTAYDTRSDSARKNPLGALEAFTRAFSDFRAGVGLVVRVQHARGVAAEPGSAERELRARAAADARVRLVDEPLAHDDVLALVASCDAYVSLHRAEGLGLGPLEAMTLGRPAVATAWSGNLDYMTAEDSLLVPAREVPVRGTSIGAYRADRMGARQTWAEPDVDAAAAHLRTLAGDPELRARLGERAAAAAARQQQLAQAGIALDELRALSEARAAGTVPWPGRAAARARVARRRLSRRARRLFVNLARAVGVGARP